MPREVFGQYVALYDQWFEEYRDELARTRRCPGLSPLFAGEMSRPWVRVGFTRTLEDYRKGFLYYEAAEKKEEL